MISKVAKKLQIFTNGTEKKILLAVSGGIDSVVLADIFKQLKIDFDIAHCNFKLRGKESDADQVFVEKLAQNLQVKLHLKICDLSKTSGNIQIAARDARYRWFKKLKNEYHFDYIVTAHHLDDSIETFFINLLRGTGLKGLLGIQDQADIIRPLQVITREDIKNYARENKLNWREDSSNASDKYQRNFIRHHIIPKLSELQPVFHQNFYKTLEFLQQSQTVTDVWFKENYNSLVTKQNDIFELDIDKLSNLKSKELFLFQWLSPYGFTDWKAINNLINKQSGKTIFTNEYCLTKHNNRLLLYKDKDNEQVFYKIYQNQKLINEPVSLLFEVINRSDLRDKTYKTAGSDVIFIDFDKISFPLIIRKWEAGDFFYPFGMQGKKKVSNYLKNLKVSLPNKKKIWLLCTQNKIVWIVGKRLDRRFQITDKTKQILHIKIVTKK